MLGEPENQEMVLQETLPPCPVCEADIDISLLEDSLRLTPWERLIENDRALALIRMLENAHCGDNCACL
jgi:hypothetical protein